MPTTDTRTETDGQRVLRIWKEYQRTHDVTAYRGQAAGIDPDTGEVEFGPTALQVLRRLDAESRKANLIFLRVGCDSYSFHIGQDGRRQPGT